MYTCSETHGITGAIVEVFQLPDPDGTLSELVHPHLITSANREVLEELKKMKNLNKCGSYMK